MPVNPILLMPSIDFMNQDINQLGEDFINLPIDFTYIDEDRQREIDMDFADAFDFDWR